VHAVPAAIPAPVPDVPVLAGEAADATAVDVTEAAAGDAAGVEAAGAEVA